MIELNLYLQRVLTDSFNFVSVLGFSRIACEVQVLLRSLPLKRPINGYAFHKPVIPVNVQGQLERTERLRTFVLSCEILIVKLRKAHKAKQQKKVIIINNDDDEPLTPESAAGARSLLLEVLRRAAYDWVLYRDSKRPEQKQMAEEAYYWVFLENEHQPSWKTRAREGRILTAFLSICEALDLRPNEVRDRIREITPHRILSSGRPPERNKIPSTHHMTVEVHTHEADGPTDFEEFLSQFGVHE